MTPPKFGPGPAKPRPAVPLPAPFIFVTEAPPIRPTHGLIRPARQRSCPHCSWIQIVSIGYTMRLDAHWCQRKSGLHCVIWETR